MNGTWKVAARNLSRNKRRNAATGFAIALGFAALLALGGYMYRVQNYLRVYTIYAARTGHIVIYQKDGLDQHLTRPKDFSLSANEQTKIREAIAPLANVQLHGGLLSGTGLIGNGCRTLPFIALGIEPKLDMALRVHPEALRWAPRISPLTKGRPLSDYPEEFGAIVAADGLARLLRKPLVNSELPKDQKPVLIADCNAPDAKDKIGADSNVQLVAGAWSGSMSALDGEIVGHYNTGVTETQNSAIITSLKRLKNLYDTDAVSAYALWLRDETKLATTLADLKQAVIAKGLNLDIYPWDDEQVSPLYTGTMHFLTVMIVFITVVLAAVIVLSIFNASTMTVIERSQEIGMMRSVGFTQQQIKSLFVKEILLLAALALAAGGIGGLVGILAVNAADIRLSPPGMAGGLRLELIPNGRIAFVAAAGIFSLAIVTTLIAMRQVVRRKIPVLLMGSQQ